MKLRTDIALEQERILEKKTQQIATQTELIKQLEEKVDKLTRELNSVKNSLEDANKTLEEKEVLIKKNDNGKYIFIRNIFVGLLVLIHCFGFQSLIGLIES